MHERQTASEIEDAAARWVWRLDGEGENAQSSHELEAWLAGDSRRRGALLRAQAAWVMLDRRAKWAPAPRVTARIKWFACAASLVALAVAWPVYLFVLPSGERIQTAVGEIRQVPLSDGSTASVNTNSALTVQIESERRRVSLEEGEAYFRVAKDAKRPFTVDVGRVRVRALGTAFSVRRHERGVEVLVTEGAVETWVEGAEGHTVRVAAGDRAFVTQNAAISKQAAANVDIDRTLAWRAGKIDLAGETLAHAIEEFNRYNTRKLTTDAKFAQQRLYGVFRTDDPEGFAQSVRRSLGAEILFSDLPRRKTSHHPSN